MRARYGQHFLRNQGAIDSILKRFSARADDAVVELGPGRGALTHGLMETAGALAAVEIDRELAEQLALSLSIPLMPADRLRSPDGAAAMPRRFVVHADAVEVRYRDLARLLGGDATRRLRVIGNLPYAVGTALIRRAIAERDLVSDALVMLQREVADRITASPGSKDYGFLAVLAALTSERARIFTLGPGSFAPPPKVRSAVISLTFPRPGEGFRDSDARLDALLRAAFTERRKKLASNLAKHYALARPEAVSILVSCGADPEARAEALAPEIFARLAAALPASQSASGRSRAE